MIPAQCMMHNSCTARVDHRENGHGFPFRPLLQAIKHHTQYNNYNNSVDIPHDIQNIWMYIPHQQGEFLLQIASTCMHWLEVRVCMWKTS